MDKRQLSERDICTKFITPALENAGWDIATHVREEFHVRDVEITKIRSSSLSRRPWRSMPSKRSHGLPRYARNVVSE